MPTELKRRLHRLRVWAMRRATTTAKGVAVRRAAWQGGGVAARGRRATAIGAFECGPLLFTLPRWQPSQQKSETVTLTRQENTPYRDHSTNARVPSVPPRLVPLGARNIPTTR